MSNEAKLNASSPKGKKLPKKVNNTRVQVVIRPRPVLAGDENKCGVITWNGRQGRVEFLGGSESAGSEKIRVSVDRDPRHANGKADAGDEVWDFQFDHILPQTCSQQDVFDTCMKDMIHNAMDGFNCTILAYGQTGAGKTYTMTGRGGKEKGLSARTAMEIFRLAEKREGSFSVKMSYLEIYNEQVFDLLDTDVNKSGKKALSRTMQILSEEGGNVYMQGLTRKAVHSEEEAFACLFEAETNRVIASHELNYSSTRSHCILTFYVEGRHDIFDESIGATTQSFSSAKINLVDLAGSERIFKTNSTGVVLQEAKAINKSLSFLEQVVIALGEKKREHIPYRQSHLTHFLRDSLGGNCKSLLIACIWPAEAHTEQTLATLKFATRMMRVKNAPVRNDKSGADLAILQEYKNEVNLLREELALRDEFLSLQEQLPCLATIHKPYSSDVLESIEHQVQSFVSSGDIKHVKPQGARHMYAMFQIMRSMVLKSQTQQRQVHDEITRNTTTSEQRIERSEASARQNQSSKQRKPPPSQQQQVSLESQLHGQQSGNQQESSPEVDETDVKEEEEEEEEEDREQLFEEFKKLVPVGVELVATLNEAKRAVLDLKSRSKALKAEVFSRKAVIDGLLESLQGDLENADLIRQLKEEKREYKRAMESLKELKSETSYSTQALKCCRERLADGFDTWCLARKNLQA